VVAHDTHSPACRAYLNNSVAQDDDDVQFNVTEGNGLAALEVGTVGKIDRSVSFDIQLVQRQTRERELVSIARRRRRQPAGF